MYYLISKSQLISKLTLESDLFRVRTRRFYNRLGRKQCPHVETVMKQVSSFPFYEFY